MVNKEKVGSLYRGADLFFIYVSGLFSFGIIDYSLAVSQDTIIFFL